MPTFKYAWRPKAGAHGGSIKDSLFESGSLQPSVFQPYIHSSYSDMCFLKFMQKSIKELRAVAP